MSAPSAVQLLFLDGICLLEPWFLFLELLAGSSLPLIPGSRSPTSLPRRPPPLHVCWCPSCWTPVLLPQTYCSCLHKEVTFSFFTAEFPTSPWVFTILCNWQCVLCRFLDRELSSHCTEEVSLHCLLDPALLLRILMSLWFSLLCEVFPYCHFSHPCKFLGFNYLCV